MFFRIRQETTVVPLSSCSPSSPGKSNTHADTLPSFWWPGQFSCCQMQSQRNSWLFLPPWSTRSSVSAERGILPRALGLYHTNRVLLPQWTRRCVYPTVPLQIPFHLLLTLSLWANLGLFVLQLSSEQLSWVRLWTLIEVTSAFYPWNNRRTKHEERSFFLQRQLQQLKFVYQPPAWTLVSNEDIPVR